MLHWGYIFRSVLLSALNGTAPKLRQSSSLFSSREADDKESRGLCSSTSDGKNSCYHFIRRIFQLKPTRWPVPRLPLTLQKWCCWPLKALPDLLHYLPLNASKFIRLTSWTVESNSLPRARSEPSLWPVSIGRAFRLSDTWVQMIGGPHLMH